MKGGERRVNLGPKEVTRSVDVLPKQKGEVEVVSKDDETSGQAGVALGYGYVLVLCIYYNTQCLV
jgi:hypothetical protein